MKKELEVYAEELKNNGFRVFVTDNETFFKFEKNGDIGYVELQPSGFNFSSVHKPNHTTGTGFSIHREILEPTVKHALDCFVIAPGWASHRDFESVKKYSGMDEYLKKETVLKYHEF